MQLGWKFTSLGIPLCCLLCSIEYGSFGFSFITINIIIMNLESPEDTFFALIVDWTDEQAAGLVYTCR